MVPKTEPAEVVSPSCKVVARCASEAPSSQGSPRSSRTPPEMWKPHDAFAVQYASAANSTKKQTLRTSNQKDAYILWMDHAN